MNGAGVLCQQLATSVVASSFLVFFSRVLGQWENSEIIAKIYRSFFFVVVGGLFVEKLNNFGASAVCGKFSHIFHGRTVCLFSIFVFFCFTVAVIVLSPR